MRPLFIKFGNDVLHSIIYLIKKNAENEDNSESKYKKKLPKTELQILMYLADIIEDKTELQQLTDSLIPFLIKSKRSGSVIISILEFLTKLMKNVSNYQS